MDKTQGRREIVEVGKRLYAKNYVASNDGNISVRISDTEILITPSGVSKGYMTESDMLTVDLEGNVLEGSLKPSSEMKMHLEVYRKRPDVRGIVHAHPQKATAFAVAHKNFDKIILPEIIFSLGNVAMAEYGTPTTRAIPDAVAKHIDRCDALLLANHGALTVGKDVFDAYYKMETLEHFAAISLYAAVLGGGVALDDEEVKRLYEIRDKVFGKKNL
jgi:L-fuculose-phosphate aldolase